MQVFSGKICPENLTLPTPKARPFPLRPVQLKKKPMSCHRASNPRHPGITGSRSKWQSKNHISGLISSSAMTSPLLNFPPFLLIWRILSTMSKGGFGRRACMLCLKSLPMVTVRRSFFAKEEG